MRKYICIFIIPVLVISVFSSCSKKGNSLDEKRAELQKLKSEQTELQGKISALEKEIGKANGNNKTGAQVHVNAIQLQPQEFSRTIDLQGLVESEKAATISAKMSGPVVGLHVTPGTMVGAGKLLVELDNSVLKSSLAEIQTQIDFARTMYDKQRRLWEQKAGSEVQYLQARNQLESLEKRLGSMKEQVNNARIYAPFAGMVDEVYPKLGETVSPGMPVVKLTGMSGIKVTAEVSETYISTVKAGDPVMVNLPELNRTIPGKVSVISRAIDPQNRTFRVEIRLSEVPKDLRPNMIAAVSLKDITKPNSIVVPISVVQHEQDRDFVYVVESNSQPVAKKRYIKIGLTYKDKAEVIEGLKPGDILITEGTFNVADGQPVSVDNPS